MSASFKNAIAQDGKASTIRKIFSRETSVNILIEADPAIIWTLLTNASDFPRWNSTVISIEGDIRKGQQIKLKSSLDPKRTFSLKVKEFEPEKRLVWGDALGSRVYTIEKARGDGIVFTMTEKIGGPLFPLFAKHIPPFDESFERFAADLKAEAETVQRSRQ